MSVHLCAAQLCEVSRARCLPTCFQKTRGGLRTSPHAAHGTRGRLVAALADRRATNRRHASLLCEHPLLGFLKHEGTANPPDSNPHRGPAPLRHPLANTARKVGSFIVFLFEARKLCRKQSCLFGTWVKKKLSELELHRWRD